MLVFELIDFFVVSGMKIATHRYYLAVVVDEPATMLQAAVDSLSA